MRLATPRPVSPALTSLHALLIYLLLCGCSGSPDVAVQSGASASSDAGVGVLDDVNSSPTGDGKTAVVYVAARGVSTPWLIVPGDPKNPKQLGPRRGAGYGLGEGEVSYPQITPDGETVVVVFYTMDTPAKKSANSVPILFALPMDGGGVKKPIRIATAPGLRALDRAYNKTHVAYVAGSSVFIARLDGSDAANPLLVAQHTGAYQVSAPHWLPDGKHVVYAVRANPVGGSSQLFQVAADGSEANKPQPVLVGSNSSTKDEQAQWLAAVMPSGRLIVRGPDSRLYRVGGNGPPVVITPAGNYVSYAGLSASGDRFAAVLRQSSQGPRRVVSLATDGSDADKPHELTNKPAAKLTALISRDAAGLAWVADDDAGKWAVWQSGLEATATARRISTWSPSRLYLTSYDHGANALLGARADGAVLRFRLDATAPEPPQVLATVPDIVNNSFPWPVLSADATHVLYDANTKTGWHGWTQDLKSGVANKHAGAWYRNLVTKWGFLTHEYVHEEAAFTTEISQADSADPGALTTAAPQQLTQWKNAAMTNATLFGAGTHLLFACETPTPGWYAAATHLAAGGGSPKATLVMPEPEDLAAHQKNAWLRVPEVVANHLVRAVDASLLAFSIGGAHANKPLTIWPGAVAAWTHGHGSGNGGRNDSSGVVVLAPKQPAVTGPAAGAHVVAATLMDGLKTPATGAIKPAMVVPVMTFPKTGVPATVSRLIVLPSLEQGAKAPASRVAAVVRQGDSTSLYVAAIDGSDHKAPLLMASNLPGWLMNVLPTRDGQFALAVLSVQPTAVPHPDLLLAIPLVKTPKDPSKAGYPIAPAQFGLWGCGEPACQSAAPDGASPRLPLTSANGKHVVVSGKGGLYSVRFDGKDVSAPTLLGAHVGKSSPQRAGDQLLTISGKALHITTIGVASSQQQLTTTAASDIVSARWIEEAKRVLFLRGGTQSWSDAGQPFVIDATANKGTGNPLVAPTFGVRRLVARLLGTGSFLVESEAGGDHSLYAVPLDGSSSAGEPQAITPIDDTTERFVGLR
ncbi:MAG: hypothetical protein KC502_11215 [Myxococcales bacterium]|nr:hypothetical protein [Myxococcales bacterium]